MTVIGSVHIWKIVDCIARDSNNSRNPVRKDVWKRQAMVKTRSTFAIPLMLAILGLAATEHGSATRLPSLVFVETARESPDLFVRRFPLGSRLVRWSPDHAVPTDLTPDLYAAADPRVSFNGRQILFAGQRRRGGHWQVWRMAAMGGKPIQVTHCAANCLRPAWLPGGWIIYTLQGGEAGRLGSQIYRSRANGGEPQPITFGPGNFRVEAVLPSGRLLVSAASPLVADASRSARALYTLRPDGSALRLFRGSYPAHTVPGSARAMPHGVVAFIARRAASAAHHAPAGWGDLAWYTPQSPHAVRVPRAMPAFNSIRPFQGQRWLLSGTALDKMAGCGIHIFDSATGRLAASVYSAPGITCAQATPLTSHPTPQLYFSLVNPQLASGRVICLDAYRSPGAPGDHLPGGLMRVRVMALEHAQPEMLGAAQVEPDGSFYLRLPANLPLRFDLLNARGAVVKAQRSWIWIRPGEDAGCEGCHEGPALTPVNHWPRVLRRLRAPIPIGLPAAAPRSAAKVRTR